MTQAKPRLCRMVGCTTQLKPWQQNCCCQNHYHEWKRHQKPRKATYEKGRLKPEKREVVPKPVRLTDEEQRRINVAIDSRYAMRFECRSLKPGDPEFERIAAEITPLHKIKKDAPGLVFSYEGVDPSSASLGRRYEDTTNLRG